MLTLIFNIVITVGTLMAAAAVGIVCLVGLVVWLAGGRIREMD